MFEELKLLISRFKSSKFVRRGKCNKCGNCCRNITLFIGDDPIKTEKQFEDLKHWQKQYSVFFVSGKDERGALLFTCKSLKEDNTCANYFLRGMGCREYPKVNKKFLINGGKPLDGCGYYFTPDKKFEEYLK